MADMKWYVLRTAGSKEKKAKDYLEKRLNGLAYRIRSHRFLFRSSGKL